MTTASLMKVAKSHPITTSAPELRHLLAHLFVSIEQMGLQATHVVVPSVLHLEAKKLVEDGYLWGARLSKSSSLAEDVVIVAHVSGETFVEDGKTHVVLPITQRGRLLAPEAP